MWGSFRKRLQPCGCSSPHAAPSWRCWLTSKSLAVSPKAHTAPCSQQQCRARWSRRPGTLCRQSLQQMQIISLSLSTSFPPNRPRNGATRTVTMLGGTGARPKSGEMPVEVVSLNPACFAAGTAIPKFAHGLVIGLPKPLEFLAPSILRRYVRIAQTSTVQN